MAIILQRAKFIEGDERKYYDNIGVSSRPLNAMQVDALMYLAERPTDSRACDGGRRNGNRPFVQTARALVRRRFAEDGLMRGSYRITQRGIDYINWLCGDGE